MELEGLGAEVWSGVNVEQFLRSERDSWNWALWSGANLFFIDTAPLIYFIEKNPKYHPILKPLIYQIDTMETKGLTSTIEFKKKFSGPSSAFMMT
jgi:hypothetical protein